MVIQFNSSRLACTNNNRSSQALVKAQNAAPAQPRALTVKANEREASFRSMLSGGVAAAGAASASDRAAATAGSRETLASAASAAPASAANAPASSSAVISSGAGAATAPSPTLSAAITSDPHAVVTAEQVFGANPWLTNPTGVGPNGLTFSYNPLYFATPSTAQQVAQMVGGKVVEDYEFTKDTPGDPFAQLQPNEMVELPNGALINPGLIASFYTHGYPNSYVNQAIASEVAGAEPPVGSTNA
jgi:hypothetical protein